MELALLGSSIATTCFIQKKIDSLMRNTTNCLRPLDDIVHNNLINLSKYEKYIDIIPIFLGMIVVYLSFFNNLDFNKLFLLLSIAFFMRAISFAMTILPSPICTNNKNASSIGGCHDCIFSGHTACTLIFAYFIHKNTCAYKKPLLIYCLLGSLFITLSRSHYTIDVFVAWLAVYFIINEFY